MTERLSTCDTWHPDTPTRMSVQKNGRRKNGMPVIKEVCIECVRIKTQIHRDELCLRKPYGVLPRLNWAPPEFQEGFSRESPLMRPISGCKQPRQSVAFMKQETIVRLSMLPSVVMSEFPNPGPTQSAARAAGSRRKLPASTHGA